MKTSFVVTCEHAGNEVPDQYRNLFQFAPDTLRSHRGWDAGAMLMAEVISKKLDTPLFSQKVTRLLIEMNRSLDSSSLFSEFSESLSDDEKELLKQQYYFPYRRSVETQIDLSKPVVHLSIHSFTPEINGVVRTVDIGLLFDPSRKSESIFCNRLREELQKRLSGYIIAFNEPYLGIDDGFTTYLRTQYNDEMYAGVEIEVNQRFADTPHWKMLSDVMASSISAIT
jgi:predicted N-formylglutamate amidohydrolase